MREKIEHLIHAVAPDLDAPLYVVLTTDEGFGDACPYHAAAITGRRLDLSFAPRLKAVGRWQGRGVAIAIDDEYLRGDAYVLAASDDALQAELFEQRLFGLTLHELGHVLETSLDLAMPVTNDAVAEQVEVLATYSKSPPELPVPFYGHAADWIRVTLHCVFRAPLIGVTVPLSLVMRLGSYRLSSPWAYRAALFTELRNLRRASFAQIRETRPPQSFIDLWQNDVARWFASLPEPTDRQERIASAYHNLFD